MRWNATFQETMTNVTFPNSRENIQTESGTGIRHLGDFTTNPRVLFIAAIAVVVGTVRLISGVILLQPDPAGHQSRLFWHVQLGRLSISATPPLASSPSWSRSPAR